MRPLFLALFLSLGSLAANGQTTPDCQFTVTFTGATVGPSFNNRTSSGATPCVKWRVAYFADGLQAPVSIQLEGANDLNGIAGTYAAIAAGQVYEGTNPLTDPAQGTAAMTAYFPWIRLNVTAFTVAGAPPHQIVARVYGYKGTSASTFQPPGSYLTALTGDCTATGPGSAACSVVKLNGGSVPASAHVLGSNAGSQPVAASATDLSAIDYVAGGGIAQAQTITLAPAVTALTNGLTVFWLPLTANTGAAPTLAVNGLAPATVTKCGATALVANDLTTTAVAVATYDGTEFQLLNPQAGSCGTPVGNDFVLGKASITTPDVGKVPVITAAGTIGPSTVNISDLDFPLALMAFIFSACPMSCPPHGTVWTISGQPALTSLPAGTFVGLAGLTSIDLDGNALGPFPVGIWDTLTALTALDIDANPGIGNPPAHAFDHNTALITLNLDTTGITALPSGLFDPLTQLQNLYLGGNPFTTLPAGIFDTLVNLQQIGLNGGGLTTVVSTVFVHNTALTQIDFAGPGLTSIPAHVFDTLGVLDSLFFDNVTSLTAVPAALLDNNTLLTTFDLDNATGLTVLPPGFFSHNILLSTLRLFGNGLTTLPAGVFDNNVALGTTTTPVGLNGNAFDAAGVNDSLASLVTCCLANAGTVNLNWGTNSAPTTGPPDGIAAAAALVAAGWTVTTNKVTLPITGVNQGSQTFTVAGDQTPYFEAPYTFTVSGSTGNDGTYTVVSATFALGSTNIVTVEAIPNATVDGSIVAI